MTRPIDDSASSAAVHSLLQTARLAHPGWETAGRVTFSAGRPVLGSWPAWRDAAFAPVLAPAFAAAQTAARSGDGRALAAIDAGLGARLHPELDAASRAAGRKLAEDFTVPPGEKLWARHRGRILAGETPGHFCVMLALRAAAFHLAPAAALDTVLLCEARGGFPEADLSVWLARINEARPAASGFQLRAA
jgi:hypothetical protein